LIVTSQEVAGALESTAVTPTYFYVNVPSEKVHIVVHGDISDEQIAFPILIDAPRANTGNDGRR
jgi:hypothetical protein